MATFEQQLDLGVHRVQIKTPAAALVSLNDEPQHMAGIGTHKIVLRGSGKLSVDVGGKEKPIVTITSKMTTEGEQVDDLPPPQPAPPSNALQQIRQKVKQAMGVTREAFADRTSIYEMGDVDVFEEDLQNEKQQNEEPQQVQSDKRDQEDSGDAESKETDQTEQKAP